LPHGKKSLISAEIPMKKFVFVTAVAALSACIRTQEMPLAPNVVRIDTQAAGLLFAGQATGQTMRRAAEITLQHGYSHFRLDQVGMSQGSEVSGIYTYGTANASGYAAGNSAYGSATSSGFATPIRRPTANVGVTVIMFHADEAGAKKRLRCLPSLA
jgi:hypothetical protein